MEENKTLMPPKEQALETERDAKAEELESTFSYDGYQVVRKELFAHLRDPAIVIRKDSITFNTACISGLEDVVYAVESILKIHKKYRSQNNICGYAFLRAFPDGKINGKKFDVDERIGSYIDVRVNGDDTGADKAEVFKTHCLKEFPFPEYPNEKFLGEDLVWVRMARKYEMVHINKAIYVGNYLEDGLTNNRRKHNIASPIGCMHRAEEFMESDLRTRYRIKGGLQYIVYGRFAGVKVVDLIRKSRHKVLATVCTPGGLFLHSRWSKAQ